MGPGSGTSLYKAVHAVHIITSLFSCVLFFSLARACLTASLAHVLASEAHLVYANLIPQKAFSDYFFAHFSPSAASPYAYGRPHTSSLQVDSCPSLPFVLCKCLHSGLVSASAFILSHSFRSLSAHLLHLIVHLLDYSHLHVDLY